MFRRIAFLLITSAIVCAFISPVCLAAEIGDGYIFRWGYTYINANGDVTKCRLKINGDNLTGAANTLYSDTVNHWNTMDSQFSYEKDKVYAYNVAFANSKCDLYSAASNSSIFKNAASGTIAMTTYKNASGLWYVDPITGNSGGFNSGTITYSAVYYKDLSGYATNKQKYIMRHEIGHVLGMGHVGSANSLMLPAYSNIHTIMGHDVLVLEEFYPNPK